MKRFPGKTFFLGEYAVLKEGPALLLAHAPFYETKPSGQAPHPDSPAGSLARKLQVDLSLVRLQDPYGKGGFGRSGAEFLAVFEAAGISPSPWEAYDFYKGIKAPGSGCDILAQSATNESAFVAIDLSDRRLEILPIGTLGLKASLFHTGVKLATHSHLTNSPSFEAAELFSLSQKGITALREGNASHFLSAINNYGKSLEAAGLLAPHSQAALLSLPQEGLLAAKGCGAMGSDVLLVIREQSSPPLHQWAQVHSLVEVLTLTI